MRVAAVCGGDCAVCRMQNVDGMCAGSGVHTLGVRAWAGSGGGGTGAEARRWQKKPSRARCAWRNGAAAALLLPARANGERGARGERRFHAPVRPPAVVCPASSCLTPDLYAGQSSGDARRGAPYARCCGERCPVRDRGQEESTLAGSSLLPSCALAAAPHPSLAHHKPFVQYHTTPSSVTAAHTVARSTPYMHTNAAASPSVPIPPSLVLRPMSQRP